MLIFSFFGQKSRVNDLAMVESITWPSFWPKSCPERWPSYWPYFFHTFFCYLFFFKNLILPAERRRFLKSKKTQKKSKNRWPSYWLLMAKLSTLQRVYGWYPRCQIASEVRRVIWVLYRRPRYIQYRTGVWKCHRSLSPDPSPSTG